MSFDDDFSPAWVDPHYHLKVLARYARSRNRTFWIWIA